MIENLILLLTSVPFLFKIMLFFIAISFLMDIFMSDSLKELLRSTLAGFAWCFMAGMAGGTLGLMISVFVPSLSIGGATVGAMTAMSFLLLLFRAVMYSSFIVAKLCQK